MVSVGPGGPEGRHGAPMVPAAGTPSRFYSLDALRGAAALSVVFWHWQHFFYRDGIILPLDRKTQPLYRVFFVLYESGWLAVDLFFTLSGFIFFWLYASAVRSRRVGPWEFFVLRFSRLYPLHLVTLLLVTAGLAAFHSVGIAAFTYPANDIYHFILQLFLASNWGFERGMSFNAPIWSVSIEVLLYAVFFVFCRYWRRPLPGVVVLIALGFGQQLLHTLLVAGAWRVLVFHRRAQFLGVSTTLSICFRETVHGIDLGIGGRGVDRYRARPCLATWFSVAIRRHGVLAPSGIEGSGVSRKSSPAASHHGSGVSAEPDRALSIGNTASAPGQTAGTSG